MDQEVVKLSNIRVGGLIPGLSCHMSKCPWQDTEAPDACPKSFSLPYCTEKLLTINFDNEI